MERVENKEKTSKCQQFALRADFSLNVAAARNPVENAQRKVEAIVPTYLLIVCSLPRIKFKRCVQVLPASQPASLLTFLCLSLTRPDGHLKVPSEL